MNHGLQIDRDERGAAIAVVLLVGTVLVLLSSVMIARGMRQLVNTNNDTNWDNALFAAEAGLDSGLQRLDLEFTYTTGDILGSEVLGSEAELGWAVAAADAKPESAVVSVTRGEYVVIRPSGSTVLFAVGYAPSRDATERRVRVIRASVDGVTWLFEADRALLVGDDLAVSGNTTVNDTNDNSGAGVHANGTVSTSGVAWVVEGCLSSSETTFAATAYCQPSPAPLEPVPVVDPLVLYEYAHYVLCDDQVVYGGPINPGAPDPDLVPCNGNETIVVLNDWESRLAGGVVEWSTKPGATTPGVFYIDNGNFKGKLGTLTSQLEATVIVASSTSTCSGASTGSIELSANSYIKSHSSLVAAGYHLALVAQGDITFGGGATVIGAIIAHEQVDYQGNADSWGSVVASGACNTPGSPISRTTTSSTTGNATINYPGPLQTPFTASTLHAEVVGWYEL